MDYRGNKKSGNSSHNCSHYKGLAVFFSVTVSDCGEAAAVVVVAAQAAGMMRCPRLVHSRNVMFIYISLYFSSYCRRGVFAFYLRNIDFYYTFIGLIVFIHFSNN